MDELELFRAAACFVFGAVVGSFLNVVIVRLPEGKSLAYPPSSCPACGHPIRPYDNVPVLSYLALRGRCRDCATGISPRYPLVELMTAFLCCGLYLKFGLTLAFVIFFAFGAALVAVYWIDLAHLIIPDAITVNGMILGVASATAGVLPGLDGKASFLGAVVGGAVLYIPAVVYEKVRGTEGVGGGDIKLLAMIGAFCGPYGAIFVLFLSSLAGTLGALFSMAWKKTDAATKIPFGPFLASAAIFHVFVGREIIERLFGS
jgi:leader peptidase (prepilin peptidase) / N-methyltransferase